MIYIDTVSFRQSDSRACIMGWQVGCTVSPFRTVCTIGKKDFDNFIKPAYINYWQNQL